ncbi:RHS repeat-associated core domain-containing protein [Gelidibacter salicanalis]|uniref:RHS repeat-associated core domain-containing protein n=1 Tax=Gelidibacter salicanalis TaxID=291193 RepID=A0A934KTI4_9FLAO|nr:RHS repeat-associated core domain-containing protein [Gelidibacter salicanalis]MBJ7880437.1 hypothetical protein [Gelidibacter salicanalis]
MNGRLYDPVVHRFLMPDNFVQDPLNTQNFDRYAYVLNNPLMYTDPSGEFIIAALIGAAIGIITNGINNSINGKGFFKGAGKAAFFGAIGGAAAFGIGQVAANIASTLGSAAFQSAAHFYTSGFLSVAQGGGFLSAALAGGISSRIGSFAGGLLKNASQVWKAVGIVGAGSVSGGVGSVIGGGNFWNGVRQGAISSGLNHTAHLIQQKTASSKLISKIEQAIEAQREAMLRFLASDPFNPVHDSFNAIDFNFSEYPYRSGILADNEYANLSGRMTIGGRKIEFNATYRARPENYVTYVKHIGSGATIFGQVLVNSFALTGSGSVVRLSIPNNANYQYIRDYIYK